MDILNQVLGTKNPIAQENGVLAYKLSQDEYNQLRKNTSAQTTIPSGATTKEHLHKHKSFYLSKKLNVLVGTGKKLLKLPEYALSVIPSGVLHPWQNSSDIDGEVCDVYTGKFVHKPHVII